VKRLTVIALLWAVPAAAQQPNYSGPSGIGLPLPPATVTVTEVRPRPDFQATVWAPLPISLTHLLNSGWSVVSQSNVATNTVELTVRRENSWAICEMDETDGSGDYLPGSQCHALN
jgi:hypothetical protein